VCRCVVGCLVELCGVFLFLFGVFVADLFVTFAGRGSGSWYCGVRLGATEDDVPIGEPFMFHILVLTAGGSGKLRGLSISQSLAVLTACVVFPLLFFRAVPICCLNAFWAGPCGTSNIHTTE